MTNNTTPTETVGTALETLHMESMFKGFKNDGKPHKLTSHINGDACVQTAKSALRKALKSAMKAAIGQNHCTPDCYPVYKKVMESRRSLYRHTMTCLRARDRLNEQRQRAKEQINLMFGE